MNSRAYSYNISHLLGLGMTVIAILSIVAYLSLTVATIFSTAHRSHASAKAAALTSEIGTLEQKYLSLEEGITLERSRELGFAAPAVVIAVVPTEPQTTLSLRN